MGRTYVRGYYRRRRRSKTSGPCLLLVIIGIGILILVLTSIPSEAYLIIFLFFLISVLVFITFRVIQAQRKKQQEIAQQSQQQYLYQIQAQQQMEQQRQVMAHQAYMAQIQVQQQRERMAQLKTLGDILTLTPTEFEVLVGKLLESAGYQSVQRVGGSGDLGVDLTALDTQGNHVVVQCKRYAPGKSIGTPDLQKFIGMMVVQHKANKGIFITTSTFKQTARDLAQAQGDAVQLVDGESLVNWMLGTVPKQ